MDKKILVIEDNPDVSDLVIELLSSEGYAVTLAKDGSIGLSFIKDDKFDLIITDLNMPNLGGIELIRRAKMIRSTMKFAVISGNVSADVVQALVSLGVKTILTKPFNIDSFLKTIRDLLS